MSDHTYTPTPWRVFKTPDGRKLVGVGGVDGEGVLDCGFGVWAWDDASGIANAEIVVRAVNSHGALVKALNEIAFMDEHLNSESARNMMNIARYALAVLKERVDVRP